MIDPSGIIPKDDKLIVKEVKPGVYTIENAYEGVYDYFAEHSTAINSSDNPSQSGSGWGDLDRIQESVQEVTLKEKVTSNPRLQVAMHLRQKVRQSNKRKRLKKQ